MACTRVVSLLPAATEIVCKLGAAGALRGITQGCPQPRGLPGLPRVVSSALDTSGMTGAEIDAAVQAIRRGGRDMFTLDEAALRRADPDLIVCQDTCEQCAAHAAQVQRALNALGISPAVHSMDPRGIGGIMEGVTDLAALLGRDGEGRRLRKALETRAAAAGKAAARAAEGAGRRPRVLAVEWIDPLYTAGHWVPEMVEAAGGVNLASSAGERSRKMTVREAASTEPDVIVFMPCGLGAARAASEYSAKRAQLAADPAWAGTPAVRAGRLFAVDAGAYFSAPGMGTVDGIGVLANILWPGAPGLPPAPGGSYMRLRGGP